ncbi:MAG: phospholipid/cholesterol/gamma-HCH transport system substrate-binding protein [Blastocatellia bacterium]
MSSTARLGAFILVALILFGVMIFLIGNKQFLFKRTYRISAPFDNVAGLEGGAPVRAGGVRIGTVQKMNLPHQPGDKVTVEMELENSTREVIKQDSIASIETEGLLGSKYVAISFGTLEAGQIRDGDTIESRPAFDYADLAKSANEMIDTAKEVIDSSKIAIANVNEASDYLRAITGKINSGQGTIGALVNDRTFYRDLQATVSQARVGITSFQDDMEALKHNFLMRGFFKKRGYYDSSELTDHAVGKLPSRSPVKQFVFAGRDLFSKPDTAKLGKEKLLNQVGAYLESNPYGLAVVVAHTGVKGEKEDNLKLSQARAMVVRQYLAQKFKVDDARIRTMGSGEKEQAASQEGDVAIVIYPADAGQRVIQAKNK